MYDIVIIGGGPAGFSAALTAKKRNMKACIIYPNENGSWLTKIKGIDNYPGMINIDGIEMLHIFERQAVEMDIEIHHGVVQQVMRNGETFLINVGSDYFESKKVIISTGIKKPALIKNEKDFIGKGLSYCATCDGMLYKDKTIAIVDENNDIEEIKFLASVAKKVFLISNSSELKDEKVEMIKGKVSEIKGDSIVRSITVNNKDYDIDGIFILRNVVPTSTLLPDLELDKNYIAVDKKMKTNIPGIYAAGDCTGEPLQIAKAVGEGNIAAISASLGL